MNKLTKNYIYNSIYQLMIVIIPLITTPYLTRTLGKTLLGIDSYVLSIVQLTNTIGSLGTNLYANREIAYVRDNSKKMAETFVEIFLIRLLLCVISSAIYLVIGLNSEYRIIFCIQCLTVISGFLDISWLFIGIEEMRPVVIRNVCVKLSVTGCIFLFVRSEDDFYKYIIIYALGQILGTLLMYLQFNNIINFKECKKIELKKHFVPILLLFFPQAATSLYAIFDKTMLGLLATDISCVSLYDKAQTIVKTPLLFASALSAVLMPRMANEFALNHLNNVKEYVKNACNFMILFFMPIAVGVYVISNNFIPWYLGTEYSDSILLVKILSPIILAVSLTNVSGAQFLVASKKTKYLTVSYISGAVLNVVGNYYIIPVMNEVGAAITTLLAEWLVFLIQFWAVHKILGNLGLKKTVLKRCLATILMFMVTQYIGNSSCSIFIVVIQIIVGVFLYFGLLFVLKDEYIKDSIVLLKTKIKNK